MHIRVCNVWKNEEYRVTLPYAKIDIVGIAKHCGQTRVKPCFLVNESSCLRVQLKEYHFIGGILHLRLNSDE